MRRTCYYCIDSLRMLRPANFCQHYMLARRDTKRHTHVNSRASHKRAACECSKSNAYTVPNCGSVPSPRFRGFASCDLAVHRTPADHVQNRGERRSSRAGKQIIDQHVGIHCCTSSRPDSCRRDPLWATWTFLGDSAWSLHSLLEALRVIGPFLHSANSRDVQTRRQEMNDHLSFAMTTPPPAHGLQHLQSKQTTAV